MQQLLSLKGSYKEQRYHQLETQILHLNRKVKDLETQIRQLTQTHVSLPTNDGILNLRIDEIIFCQANSNYTHIQLIGGKRVLISKTLKYIQSLLPETKFIRIHQSYLANVLFIQDYHLGKRAKMLMKNGELLSISKSGVQRIQKMYNMKSEKKIYDLIKVNTIQVMNKKRQNHF